MTLMCVAIDHAHKLKKTGLTSPNWNDTSISLDERQIKESRGGWQSSFHFPTYLGRSKETLLEGYHSMRLDDLELQGI